MSNLPVVFAKDMLTAQSYTPTHEEMSVIKARADFFEAEGLSREVHIRVRDIYTGATIGHLIFNVAPETTD